MRTRVLQFLPIELRVAECQVDVSDERPQFLPTGCREPEESGVIRGEESRRRDVVVLQDAGAVERRKRLASSARGARSERS